MRALPARSRRIPPAPLLATIVLWPVLAALPAFAATNCQEPRDFGQLAHCFLGQYRCLPNYFGIDAAPNYPEALKCFEANRHWPFVVLMYLNGQGTKRDLKKAESVLRAEEKADPDEFGPHQAETLQKAIDACKGAQQSRCRGLDYCKDLSITTRDMEICDAVEQVSDEAVFRRAVGEARSKLSITNRVLFDRVIAEFKGYQLDEMEREYEAYAGASLRRLAGANQASFVRENFLKLITETIAARRLKPASPSAFHAVNTQLERELGRNLRHNIEARQELLNDPNAKELWDRERSDIEDYRNAAKESQFQWIKFRDSCAQLATWLYSDQAGKFDPAVSMKTIVTKNRVAELRSEPFPAP